ncbi:MAG: DUF3108 domain-containing protein [Halofilum sp. (in: g-proteobacteria)]|nr:DUF3108 domain-containing protein [Halofilum sp. (in: g-proteobacteria)]
MSRCPPRRHSLAALLLAALLAAPAASAGGDGLPAPLRAFEAEYRVVRSGLRLGTTSVALAPHGGGWRYRSVTEAEGLFSLFVDGAAIDQSVFTVRDGGLRPLRYRHEEPDAEDNLRVDFRWGRGEARVEHHEGAYTVALEPRTHDPFTVILSVMQALAAGKDGVAFPGIDDDGERVELRFEVSGRETVEVPLGRYESVRVRRVRDDKRSTVTWFAPGLDWLPVRFEQRRKGDLVARMELEALDGRRAEPEEPRRPRR